MNLKHLKISLLPRYLKTGENNFQNHGEGFCPVLDFIFPSLPLHDSFSVCRLQCVCPLCRGTLKPSVDFQKYWCTANLLEACMGKRSSHLRTPQCSTIACLLPRCLSQPGSGNCCLPQCENETDSQGVLKHRSCQTNMIIPFSKCYGISDEGNKTV